MPNRESVNAVQELYKPHDGSPYGKKKEAIEQFTALEPDAWDSQRNSQCRRRMDVLRQSL
jgi:hypothetical protein